MAVGVELGYRPEPETGPRHHCGLAGVVLDRPSPHLLQIVANGMDAQQHRGQEGAGISWIDEQGIRREAGFGLRQSALPDNRLPKTHESTIGIGHLRYSTSGGKEEEKNLQPFRFRRFSIGHNGTVHFDYETHEDAPNSDTYRVGRAIADGIEHSADFEKSAISVLSKLNGAYTLMFATEAGVYVAVDPWGFRPAAVGRLRNGVSGMAVASETVGLEAMDAKLEFFVPRGAFVKITAEGAQLVWQDPRTENLLSQAECSFEGTYFADAASRMPDGRSNHFVRSLLGQRVAERFKPGGDFVSPIPNSGWSYAEGVALQTGLPMKQAIQVNRGKGRNFIQPHTPEERMKAAFLKYKFIHELIVGQELIIVDDSIVRGNTTQGLVLALFKLGAKRVELVSGAPPITHPCYWGVDFADPNELIFNKLMNDNNRKGTFEERLAMWLVGDDYNLAQRLRVSFQQLEDYVEINRNKESDGTLLLAGGSKISVENSGGCFHCVSGMKPQGTIVNLGRKIC